MPIDILAEGDREKLDREAAPALDAAFAFVPALGPRTRPQRGRAPEPSVLSPNGPEGAAPPLPGAEDSIGVADGRMSASGG